MILFEKKLDLDKRVILILNKEMRGLRSYIIVLKKSYALIAKC